MQTFQFYGTKTQTQIICEEKSFYFPVILKLILRFVLLSKHPKNNIGPHTRQNILH